MAIGCLSAIAGCQYGPERIPAPEWEPAAIVERAFTSFDANNDSALALDELKEAPGLASAFKRLDLDKDGRLSREEVQERFELYQKLGTGLVAKTFEVAVNGRYVAGAKVEFVPEEYQGGVTSVATGVTDVSGYVSPKTEGQELRGLQVGLYRVKIYDPRSQNADQIESRVPVGVEVTPLSEIDQSGTPLLHFKT